MKVWVKNAFLNENLKVPFGLLGTLRTQIEADLLLQNLMLVADAMGLGAWIHATISPPVMMGDPKFEKQYGKMLGFDFVTPRWRLLDLLRWHVPLPKYANLRAHPISLKAGDEFLIKAKCPPNYGSMSDAVSSWLRPSSARKGFTRIANCLRGFTNTASAMSIWTNLPNTLRRDRMRAATSVTTSTTRTADSRRIATRSTCRGCGCKSITSRPSTTSASSATN